MVRFGAQHYGAGYFCHLQTIADDGWDICFKRDILALAVALGTGVAAGLWGMVSP